MPHRLQVWWKLWKWGDSVGGIGDWRLGMTLTGGGGAYELCVCTDV